VSDMMEETELALCMASVVDTNGRTGTCGNPAKHWGVPLGEDAEIPMCGNHITSLKRRRTAIEAKEAKMRRDVAVADKAKRRADVMSQVFMLKPGAITVAYDRSGAPTGGVRVTAEAVDDIIAIVRRRGRT